MEAAYKFGPYKIDAREVFHSTPLSYAMVNLRPLLPVCPKREVKRFADLSSNEISDLWVTAKEVGIRLEQYHKASSLTFAIQCLQDGPQAGQTVPHVHIHVIPRKKGDFEKNDEIYDALPLTSGKEQFDWQFGWLCSEVGCDCCTRPEDLVTVVCMLHLHQQEILICKCKSSSFGKKYSASGPPADTVHDNDHSHDDRDIDAWPDDEGEHVVAEADRSGHHAGVLPRDPRCLLAVAATDLAAPHGEAAVDSEAGAGRSIRAELFLMEKTCCCDTEGELVLSKPSSSCAL
uniref:Bis(5'-adenosyl)-triphosphatase n=1 Tax=Oryza sativa subsp. japonica TaxID=39947 RepID=Q2RB94_ORYSJ|nr:HIT domain containing protein [Oryza sativa Japonica Group]